MKLTEKLIDYLHSAFNKDPDAFTAFRVRHSSDAFGWGVSERVFYGYLSGVEQFSVDLTAHTLGSLINHLASLPGIAIVYFDADMRGISACSLLDGSGLQSQSNGDIVKAYRSLIWMYLDAVTTELVEAKKRIIAMLDQMSVKTADDKWLDEWGGYFGVFRFNGETDTIYSNRIIAEVLRSRGNNKAIEIALLELFGQVSTVENVVAWESVTTTHDSTYDHDSTITYSATTAKPRYGLFRIGIGYDILGSTAPDDFVVEVANFIDRIRDAGTHLESILLSSSAITDSFTAPVDGGIALLVDDILFYDGSVIANGSDYYAPVQSAEFI